MPSGGGDELPAPEGGHEEMLERVERELERVRRERDEARGDAANLRAALVSARRIGAAVGIVMARYRVRDDEAFAMLSQVSQRHHRKIRDVAEQVVLTGQLDEFGSGCRGCRVDEHPAG